ncbi:MAG: PDZ domain-containing protein [Thermoleophilia bacterium]|nr:PDZ domain-containing protein [Thermoleophilia bacterium]
MKRFLTPGKLLGAFLAIVVVTVGLLLVLPDDGSYIFLPDEPHLVDPVVEVEGGQPPDDEGGLHFVDVIVRRPSIAERLLPGVFHDGASLVPAHAVNPAGLDEADRRRSSLQVMSRSQRVAAAVALREAGHDVEATENGALVVQVLPDTPAAGRLHPADVIVEVDGTRIDTVARLRAVLAERRPGQEVSVAVRRGDERLSLEFRLAADPQDPARGVLGVLVEQSVDIGLPLDVEIDAGNIGGPSAGLAFALGVLEELGRDVDRGLLVAITGSLALDGSVGAVGGIKQKAIGAREAGIEVFLVPAGDNAEEARRHAEGMRIVPVESFQQALQALATAAENGQD